MCYKKICKYILFEWRTDTNKPVKKTTAVTTRNKKKGNQ